MSYIYKNTFGEYRLVEGGERLSRLELWTKRYTLRYKVTRQAFEYKNEREYYSKDPVKNFFVILRMNISVKDPIAIVKSEIDDVQSYLDLNIPFWIQPIIEKYGIEDIDKVKKVVQQIDQCTEIRSDLESKGFAVNQVLAHVRLSKEDWEHLKKIEDMKKKQELAWVEMQNKRKLQMQEQEWALKDEQRLKEIESEEKEKLLEVFEKYGVYGGIIQGASKQQFVDILLKDNDELKSFRKKAFDKILELQNMDIFDIINTIKLVEMRNLTSDVQKSNKLIQTKDQFVEEWDKFDRLLEAEKQKKE